MKHRKVPSRQRRGANPLAMYSALSSSRRFEPDEKVDVILPLRIAFEALASGTYTDDDVGNLYTAACLGLKILRVEDTLHQCCLNARAYLFTVYEQLMNEGICVNLETEQRAGILTVVEIYEAVVEQVTPARLLSLIEDIKIHRKPTAIVHS
jgi:hypothetical protein